MIEQSIAQGQSPGAQLFVSLRGQVLADAAFGESRPGVSMTPDTLVLWMSMGKPITAILVARLLDAGRFDVNQPVADFIPEFSDGGKLQVTVAHLLTHSGGFRHVGSNWSAESWEAIVSRISAADLEEEWVIGETAGYHTSSSWFVLAEVARRLLGDEDPRQMYRREIFEPLGMPDCWIGMPRHRWIDYGTQVGYMFDTSKLAPKGIRPVAFPNSEAGSTLCRPGGNGRGPMNQLGRFYEQLLIDRGDMTALEPASNAGAEPLETGGAATRLLSRDTARLFTSCRLCDVYDRTFGTRLDWGYGFIVNAPDRRFPYNYGPHASAEAFGHSGNQSTCAFADPAHGLVVCWASNGMPGELSHQRRQRAINTAIYEDLGLAGA